MRPWTRLHCDPASDDTLKITYIGKIEINMGESMSVCHCKDLRIDFKIELIQIISDQFVLIKKRILKICQII